MYMLLAQSDERGLKALSSEASISANVRKAFLRYETEHNFLAACIRNLQATLYNLLTPSLSLKRVSLSVGSPDPAAKR